MSLNHLVDAAVDKAAMAAKMKVKSMLGGGGAGGTSKPPSKSGGIGGLFPSAGDSGNGNQKKGGLFGGLLSTEHGDMHPGAGGAGGAGGAAAGGAGGAAANQDFNSAVDELNF